MACPQPAGGATEVKLQQRKFDAAGPQDFMREVMRDHAPKPMHKGIVSFAGPNGRFGVQA